MCSKFTGECPRRSEVSIKLLYIALIALLKSYFDMGVLLYICCIFSEHIFLRTPLEGCLWDKHFQKLLEMGAFGFDCFFLLLLLLFEENVSVCDISIPNSKYGPFNFWFHLGVADDLLHRTK